MIGVAGLSHLGVVTSAALASLGFEVVGFDPRPELGELLRQGNAPFFEPGLAELLRVHQARLEFTHDPHRLAACSVVIIALDVATDDAGRSDVTGLTALVDQVMQTANASTIFVLLSQVAPGFTRQLAARHSAVAPNWFYQVETLIFGNAVERALKPERFIVGCQDPEQPLPSAYERLLRAFGCPVLPMRYESAETTKLAINLFLTSSVCVTNTLAEICEKTGADWAEIVPALKLDRRIGPYAYLQPGLGIGGGNLERDLATITNLAQLHGTEASTIAAWRRNSQHRRDWALNVLRTEVLAKQPEASIGIWGLAYKPDTASTKNSPALNLIDALPQQTLKVFDPQARLEPRPHCRQVATPWEACEGAAALTIMTAWKQFAQVDPHELRQRLSSRVVIDPYGVLDRQSCRAAGLTYFRLGCPPERGEA